MHFFTHTIIYYLNYIYLACPTVESHHPWSRTWNRWFDRKIRRLERFTCEIETSWNWVDHHDQGNWTLLCWLSTMYLPIKLWLYFTIPLFRWPIWLLLPLCSWLFFLLPLDIFFPQILDETKEKLEHMTALANQRDTEIGPLTPLTHHYVFTPLFQFIRWRCPPFR